METVWVGGDEPRRRDFVAGLLYLGGQARVMVLRETMSNFLARREVVAGAGVTRGLIRDPIYLGQVRDERIVLGLELREALAGSSVPAILDGRTEEELRGVAVPGRIPGARSYPADTLRAGSIDPVVSSAIVYAGDSFDSIAYFTLIRATTEIDAQVYIQGWREWSARFPDFIEVKPAREPSKADERTPWSAIGLALITLAVGLVLAGAAIGRRRR